MAVSAAGFSVIVRNDVLDEHFPGGVEAYRKHCPNGTFCTDGRVTRVGFMAEPDVKAFFRELVVSLQTCQTMNRAVAVLRNGRALTAECDWLQAGMYEGRPITWLAAEDPGNLFIPAVELQSAPLQEITPGELKRSYEFIGTSDGVESYRHRETGRVVYLGRTN